MNPPRLARFLVGLVTHPDDRRFLLEDLAEEHRRRVATEGRGRAAAWYWRQAAGSLAPLAIERLRRISRGTAREPHWAADAAQARRWLLRNPGLAATIAATLIVALTTTFAAWLIVHAVLLRPLPFPAGDALVEVVPSGPSLPATVRVVSLPDFEDLQSRAGSAALLSGFTQLTFTQIGAGDPRRVDGLRVGRGFARVFDVTPVLGRDFEPRDFAPGAQYVALITDGLWRRQFGASSQVLGQALVLDDRSYEIVGVLPRVPFEDVTQPHEFWVPLVARPGVAWEPGRGNGFINLVARLSPGTSQAAAQARFSAVAADLAARYPRSNRDKPAVIVRSLHETIVGPVRQPLLLVLFAVGAVLVVACGNLANLLLAQAERRRREFAVRLAIGAEPHRIRSQVLLEMCLVVGAAGLVALALAPGLADLFLRLYPSEVPGTSDLRLSWPTMGAAAALTMAIALGLAVPQVRRLGAGAGNTLSAPRMTGTRQERRARAVLIAVQVAFTVVVAFGGLALVRSMARLTSVDPGFDPQGLIAFSVNPSPSRFGSAAGTRAFFEQLLTEVRALPGVRGAAASTAIPFVSQGWSFPLPNPDGGSERVLVGVTVASPGYFETLGIPVVAGRLLTDSEHTGDRPVIVLNDVAAGLLPYPNPVGRTLRYSGTDWTITGVVRSVRQRNLRRPAAAELYLPWSQAGRRPQRIVLRTVGNPSAVVPLISARLREIDPGAPVADIMPIEDRVARSIAGDRFRATLLASLAAIAVLLAGLGVWSVTACVVARQERENGIRAALGESRRRLLGRMLARTLRPALAGACLGLGLSWWAGPLLQVFLYEIPGRNPGTIAAASIFVLAMALAAALPPARRALRGDPAAALRVE